MDSGLLFGNTNPFSLPSIDPYGPLNPEETKELPAADGKGNGTGYWKILRRKNYYQCDCPSFRYQYNTLWEHRTCKHLIQFRGQQEEDDRIQEAILQTYGPTGKKTIGPEPFDLSPNEEKDLGPLKDMETEVVQIAPKAGTWTVQRKRDYYQCTCPAFKYQKGIHWEARTCKHIIYLRGEKQEKARCAKNLERTTAQKTKQAMAKAAVIKKNVKAAAATPKKTMKAAPITPSTVASTPKARIKPSGFSTTSPMKMSAMKTSAMKTTLKIEKSTTKVTKSTAMKASAMKSTAMKASAMKSTAMKASAMKSTPMKASAMKSTPMKASAMKSTPLKTSAMKAGNSKKTTAKTVKKTATKKTMNKK